MRQTVGIILTGGLSTRMGTDKATMLVAGKPMVVSVADALWEAGLHPVECQGGDAAAIEQYGLFVFPDTLPGAGPLVAIRTALARHPDSDVVVVACDLVDVDVATIRALVEQGAASADAAVVAANADGQHHMLAWWRAGVGEELASLTDEGVVSYQDALIRLSAVDFPVEPRVVRNLNSPADLAVGE